MTPAMPPPTTSTSVVSATGISRAGSATRPAWSLPAATATHLRMLPVCRPHPQERPAGRARRAATRPMLTTGRSGCQIDLTLPPFDGTIWTCHTSERTARLTGGTHAKGCEPTSRRGAPRRRFGADGVPGAERPGEDQRPDAQARGANRAPAPVRAARRRPPPHPGALVFGGHGARVQHDRDVLGPLLPRGPGRGRRRLRGSGLPNADHTAAPIGVAAAPVCRDGERPRDRRRARRGRR